MFQPVCETLQNPERYLKKAAELTESQKTPHFVQLVKEVIEE